MVPTKLRIPVYRLTNRVYNKPYPWRVAAGPWLGPSFCVIQFILRIHEAIRRMLCILLHQMPERDLWQANDGEQAIK
jgi:hypothetical protein